MSQETESQKSPLTPQSQFSIDMSHTNVPKYGLKFKFNHKFPDKENFDQNLKPSLKQIWNLMPMMLRYVPYYWRSSKGGSMVLMDYFAMRNHDGIYGCPMGGIAGKL